MPPIPELLLPAVSVIFLAGLIQGLSGFGSALVAVPLLALLMPVETVVPLMTLLAIAISAFNLLHLRHAARLQPVLRLLTGYVLGTPLGLYFLTRAPEALVLGVLGLFISGYALFSLAGRQPQAPWLRQWRVGLGVISGSLGAAFSTNGPPVILHVAAHREWDADRQKVTLTLFFLISSLVTATAHGLGGLITREVLQWLLWSAPFLAAGTLAGIHLYRRLGERNYKQITFVLILATGLILMGRSLAGG